MKIQHIILLSTFIFSAGILSGCGGGSSSPATPISSTTYSTTSNKGDYSEWTLSGNPLIPTLNASWEVINSSGGVGYTYTFAATCSAVDANNVHQCTYNTVSCAAGLTTCPAALPTGTFDMMEVPGVALLVHTTTGGDELQVGFVKDAKACTEDVSGDYTFIRTGVGIQDSFGIYRSDKNLINIDLATFGFDTPATTSTGYTSQSLTYRVGSSGAGTLTDGGCTNGLRQRKNAGAMTRAMMTASGLFVLDMPAGDGGMLSFNVKKAASLADFANKSFDGIVFPDDGSAQPFHASFGTIASNKIDFSISLANQPAFQKAVGSGGLNIMALGTPSALTGPAYPGFSTAPAGYSSSPLQAAYNTPKDMPGLFKMGKFLDRGRVILAAMKFNNKVIAIGMTDNYRDTHDINPSTGKSFPGPGVYNSGNFILFEK